MTPIAIPDNVLAAIYAHAIAAFPDECCGYLVGAAPGAVDGAVPCRNAQADGEHPIAPERGADTGFVIAGAELFRFARSFDTDRPARIVYHSHTHGRAYFSTVDRRMAAGPAYPVQHVVVGVAAPSVTPQGFPQAKESRGPYPAIDPLPSVTRGPYPAIDPLPSVTPQGFPRAKESPTGFPRAKESPTGFPRAKESRGPYPAIDPLPSVTRGPYPAIDPLPSVTRGPYPAIDPLPSVTPQGFPRAKESRGPYPAIDPLPSVTEVAQFAWSEAARDYVEVARWAVDGAPR